VNGPYAVAVAVLFGAGVYAMLHRDLIRVIVGVALMSYAVNLFLLAVAQSHGVAPIHPLPAGEEPTDPLPQALVLTAVVIGAGTTAVMIGFVNRAFTMHGSVDEPALTSEQDVHEGRPA